MEKSKNILFILIALVLIGSLNFVCAEDASNLSSSVIDNSSLSSASMGGSALINDCSKNYLKSDCNMDNKNSNDIYLIEEFSLNNSVDSINLNINNKSKSTFDLISKNDSNLNLKNMGDLNIENISCFDLKVSSKDKTILSNSILYDGSKRSSNIQANDLVKYYLNGTNLVAYLTDGVYGSNLRNREITLTIGDNIYSTVSNDFGIINFDIDLIPGNYEGIINFEGDSKYDSFSKLVHITVLEMPTNITAYNVVMYYLNGTSLLAYLDDINGNPLNDKEVNISINNQTFTKITDKDGMVSLSLDYIPGVYNAVISFEEEYYIKSNKTVKVAILEKPTEIVAYNITKDFGSNKNLIAYLVDINQNPLSNKIVNLVFNGEEYNLTTDDEGAINFSLDYEPGFYEAKFKFSSNYHLSSSKTVSVTILKLREDAIHVSLDGDDELGDGSLNNPYKAISNAISKAENGSFIYIHNGTYSGENNTNLVINKDLRFSSVFGDVFINVSGQGRVFTVLNGVNLDLIGLNFVSGNVTAFNSTTTVSVPNNGVSGSDSSSGGSNSGSSSKDSTFNIITFENYTSGGAIYSLGNLNITDCIFTNNSALNGGAIYSVASLVIDSTNFIKNRATQYGGAIYNRGFNNLINNTIFTANSAVTKQDSASGGAIYNLAENLTISNTVFNSNYVTETSKLRSNITSGGAISNHANYLTVDNCNFISNYAEVRDNGMGALSNTFGGAIYSSVCKVNMSNNNFFNDTAHTKSSANYASIYGSGSLGGAIYVTGGGPGLYIFNNTFTNCSSAYGAMRIFARNAQVINNTFDNNKAQFMGSALYDTGDNTTYKGNSFINHNATNNLAQGTVYIYSHNAIFEDNYFDSNNNTKDNNDNSASIYIYNPGYYTKEKTNYVILNNTFSNSKEGIYFYGAYGALIKNNTFINHTYQAFTTYVGSDVEVIGNHFENNHGYFGTIWFNSYNSTFTNNTFLSNSGTMGGAIALLVRDGINITGNNFINNSAKSGGAIYGLYSNATINYNYFKDNFAENGTALYLDASTGSAKGNIFNNTGDSYNLIYQTRDNMFYLDNDIYLHTYPQDISEYVNNHVRTPNDFNLIGLESDSIDLDYSEYSKNGNYNRYISYNDGSSYYSDDIFDSILEEFNKIIEEIKSSLIGNGTGGEGTGSNGTSGNATDSNSTNTNNTDIDNSTIIDNSTEPVDNKTDVDPGNGTNVTNPVENGTNTNPGNGTNVTVPDNSTNVTNPVENSTNVTVPDNSTNVTNPVENSTNVTVPDNSTNVTNPVENSTNVTVLDNSTNVTVPIENSTDIKPVNSTNITVPIDNSTNVTVPDNSSEINSTVPVENSTEVEDSTNMTEPIDNGTEINSTVPVENSTDINQDNTTNTTLVENISGGSGYVDDKNPSDVGESESNKPSDSTISDDSSNTETGEDISNPGSDSTNYESDSVENSEEGSDDNNGGYTADMSYTNPISYSVGTSYDVEPVSNAYELNKDTQEMSDSSAAIKMVDYLPLFIVFFILLLIAGYITYRDDHLK